MAIVSVSSHSLSTRIDCSVFSLRRSKSSLMAIRVATDTFIYALMRFYSNVCYIFPWKAKKKLALVRRNDFLKREVILRSSLLSSVKIFDISSECAVFQNLVPELHVKQLSLQAFINQKLLSLKKNASTSFLLVCSGVTGHRLPIEPIWMNFSIQRGQRTSEGTRLTSNKRSVMWTAPLFATNMLSWGDAQKDYQLTCR